MLWRSRTPERNRTSDLAVRSGALYPLSYEGKVQAEGLEPSGLLPYADAAGYNLPMRYSASDFPRFSIPHPETISAGNSHMSPLSA